MEAKSVENISLSSLRGVNLILLVQVNVRYSVLDGPNAVICLITNMKTTIRSDSQATDEFKQTVDSKIVICIETVTR